MNRFLLPLALLASLVAAGCMQDATATPEERAQRAADRLETAMGPEGDLRLVKGTMSAEGMKGELELKLGQDEVNRIEMTFGGFITVIVHCTPDVFIMSMGGETYESRPTECFEESPMGEGESPLEALQETELVEASEKDGVLTAKFRETNATGNVSTIQIQADGQDRITKLTVEDQDGKLEVALEYGAREKIQLPTADGRIPANVETEIDFDDETNTFTWKATGAEEQAPLGEFEVRVKDQDGNVLATFPTLTGAERKANFTYTFTDNGDGMLGEGDSFTLSNPDWEMMWDYDVEVYDTWASAALGESPMPAPGILAALGALGLASLALSRRR